MKRRLQDLSCELSDSIVSQYMSSLGKIPNGKVNAMTGLNMFLNMWESTISFTTVCVILCLCFRSLSIMMICYIENVNGNIFQYTSHFSTRRLSRKKNIRHKLPLFFWLLLHVNCYCFPQRWNILLSFAACDQIIEWNGHKFVVSNLNLRKKNIRMRPLSNFTTDAFKIEIKRTSQRNQRWDDFNVIRFISAGDALENR